MNREAEITVMPRDKPANTNSHQKPEEAGNRFSPLEPSGRHHLDFRLLVPSNLGVSG